LHRHGPQHDLGALLDAGFLEQLLGFFRVERRVLDAGVIGPLGRRHGANGQLACTLVHRVDDLLLVHRHVQGLANLELGHRVGFVAALDLVHHVVGDVTEVEARLMGHLQIRVFTQGLEVGRTREKRDLALVLLELLDAYRGVGGDGEDQVVDLDVFWLPVVLVAGIADVRVFLVALEHKRAGADRFLVDVGRLAFLEQLVGVLGGLDGGKVHRHVLDKRGIDRVQGELDGLVIDLFHLGDVFIHAHVGEIREFGGVGLTERHVLVEHAVEREEHVVGIEITGRLEVRRGVELDAIAQVEGPCQVIRRDIPAGSQAGLHLGAATFELAQTVKDGLGRCIEVSTSGVLARVKTCRAAFRAKHQVGSRVGERCTCQQAGAY